MAIIPPMTASTASATDATPAAVTAFLHGIGRRGLVLAICQCGDREAGLRALAAAMRSFRGRAGQEPLAHWPAQFWPLLAASPLLRHPHGAAHWPQDLAALAPLAPADRLALLLRIAAGLDEAAAAAALAIEAEAYRDALARACPRDEVGRPDAAGWRTLAEAVQVRVRELPEAWLRELDSLARGELGPAPSVAAPAAIAPARSPRALAQRSRLRWWRVAREWGWRPERRTLLAGLVGVAAVLLVALVWRQLATRVELPPDRDRWTPAIVSEPLEGDDIKVAPLPATPDPADRAMLADPDLALAREADFYAWVAAGAPAPAADEEPAPASAPLPLAEGAEPTVAVAASAPDWQALGAAERRDLRACYAAWRALPEAERAQLRAAATRVQALDPAQRQALRRRFDALDRLQREGWRLGPSLGRDWPGLQPLFGYVPAAQREALLGLLRALDPEQRGELVRLAARTPPERRAALRQTLLALPAGERGAWLARQARR